MLPFKNAVLVICVSSLLALTGCSGFSGSKKDKSPQETTADSQSEKNVDPKSVADTPTSKAQQQLDAGVKAMQSGRDKEAEQIFADLIKSYPTLPGPYTNIGIIYQRSKRMEDAQQAFLKAAAINPANKIAYSNLGLVYRNLGQFEDARKAYEKAIEIDAGYAPAHLNLAILFDIYMSDLPKALEHYERYKQLVPTEEKQVSAWIADLKQRGVPSEKQSTGAKP